ncbi:MAG: GNAT family N-acetyltransferase [Desulfohalobiaceae bacterium]|nr:GNAT family N-acetyltransferase [Desulfohalobiaceae bacterium]
MVYSYRNSKDANLENIAIDPDFRGSGLGGFLLDSFIWDNSGIIILTTRIPEFFSKYGFKMCTQLSDESNFIRVLQSSIYLQLNQHIAINSLYR